MMNLIALSLIATSLAVSGFFSPSPVVNDKGEQVIVKDGHRAVVVEYGDTIGDGNTKVSISPPQHTKGVETSDDALSRATASVAGVAQDVTGKAKEAMHGGPRELICDAYGKCKHKVAGVLNRAKERAGRAEEAVEDAAEEALDKAKGFASKATGRVEETAAGARDKVYDATEKVKETGERVRDVAGGKVREAGEKAWEAGEKVRDVAGGTVRGAGEKAREAGEKVKGKAEEVVEETKEKGRKGKKQISDIAKRGKEAVMDVIRYVFRVDSIGNLMTLMGFAMAYGTGIWLTFVQSYVLAGILPKQQFAMVQSKVYPQYFRAMVGSIGLALLGHLLGHRSKVFKTKPEFLQGYNLLSSLLMVLANLLFVEPRATKVLFEKMRLEKEEGRGREARDQDSVATTRVVDTVVTDGAGPVPTTIAGSKTTTAAPSPARREDDQAKIKLARVEERLKKFNSYSGLLNTMTLMGLSWHLMYLSQRLGVHSGT